MNYIDCKKEYENKIYKTAENTNIRVIEYIRGDKVLIEFESGYRKYAQMALIKRSSVKDREYKRYFGVACIGFGKYEIRTRAGSVWSSMISRCYNIKDKDYKNYGELGFYVCDEWLNFQNYAKWYEENYIENYVVDKDVLYKNNKIYSPNTCRFIPIAINSIFADMYHGELPYGVRKKKYGYEANIRKYGKRIYLGRFRTIEDAFNKYKIEKESYIKELANLYKDTISKDVYDSLMNFTINIDD